MNKQEFGENMLLLRRQVELLTYNLGIRAEFSTVNTMYLPNHIECSYEIRLKYEDYNTTDIFNNTNTFGTDDINKVAVALVSSFFADYVGALSLRVNK
tara:strand:- start:179 stop:472 length:294 start_codon:yes stop_codon:yes gene_type:complete